MNEERVLTSGYIVHVMEGKPVMGHWVSYCGLLRHVSRWLPDAGRYTGTEPQRCTRCQELAAGTWVL